MVDLTLAENSEQRAFVDGLGAKGVPVIVSDFHAPIIGFRPDELKALIEAYKSSTHSGDLTQNGKNDESD